MLDKFTDLLIANKTNSTKPFIYKSDLISIHIGSFKIKNDIDKMSIENNISLIDYSECEDKLKKLKVINLNDSIRFVKKDLNTALKIPPLLNNYSTDSNLVSYQLYNASGKPIDMNLCINTSSIIKIPLNISNSITNLNEFGYNLYDSTDLSSLKQEVQKSKIKNIKCQKQRCNTALIKWVRNTDRMIA